MYLLQKQHKREISAESSDCNNKRNLPFQKGYFYRYMFPSSSSLSLLSRSAWIKGGESIRYMFRSFPKCIRYKTKPLFQHAEYPFGVSLYSNVSLSKGSLSFKWVVLKGICIRYVFHSQLKQRLCFSLCCFCNRYISVTCFPLHFFSLSFLVEHDSRVERVSPRCFAIQKDSAT